MSIDDQNGNVELPPEDPPSAEFPPEVFLSADFIPETATPVTETASVVIEKLVQPEEQIKPADRSTMSQSTMIFGLVALSLYILGASFLVFDAFQNGLPDNLLNSVVKIAPVTLAYLVGWSLCLLSIRSFSNLVLPLLIKYYSWIMLTGLVIIYLKIMQNLFEQNYDFSYFLSYNIILASWLAGLIGLNLLLEEQNFRRSSIPIIMANIWHLLLMVIHFVVLDQGNPIYLFGDLYFFIVMFGLAALMLAHLGVLNPVRVIVVTIFRPSENKETRA
jgi:hypothetical protein